MFSYHGGHSKDYCCHAAGFLEDILKAYSASGFDHIAVTEHLPSQKDYLYPEEEEFGWEELEKRFNRLMDKDRPKLHERYNQAFQDFRVGFETEYYGKDPLGRIEQAIDRYNPEIVVASVHHVDNIPIDFDLELFDKAKENCGGLENLFMKYYVQQYQLIKALANYSKVFPIIVGHMDLIKLYQIKYYPDFQASPDILCLIERNIRAAVDAGLVFEINSRGIKKGVGIYPGGPVLERIAKSGGHITFGDDSHAATDVGLYFTEAKKAASQFFARAVVFESDAKGAYSKREVLF